MSAATAIDSAPLWAAFQRGELRLPICEDCGRPHLPPGPVCPYCLGDRLDWRPASRRARLSSWVVERKKWFDAFDPPYIIAEVELEEGPRMPAQVDLADADRLKIHLSGRITFRRAANGLNLPLFTLEPLASRPVEGADA